MAALTHTASAALGHISSPTKPIITKLEEVIVNEHNNMRV